MDEAPGGTTVFTTMTRRPSAEVHSVTARLRRRLRRATSSLRTRWRRAYRRGGPQTRAPGAATDNDDGFLAKFSGSAASAGAPASTSTDSVVSCWQNRLVVDPTMPFHYRVSTNAWDKGATSIIIDGCEKGHSILLLATYLHFLPTV
ncbi:hypothetical protein C0J52_05518 [Blattella germanica]|nr:hypothetical protein C0J52_05518 [Blattella germanica]